VDVYDAMTTTRPYRAAVSSDEALDALAVEVDRGWRRADLVEAFTAARRGTGQLGAAEPWRPGLQHP
jgi:response regulator RpfG family c-di-GMP phosphodiesterase